MDGQMSIFDYPEYLPGEKTEQIEEPRKQVLNIAAVQAEDSPAEEYFKLTAKTTYWQDSQGKESEWYKKENLPDEEKAGNCIFCAWYNHKFDYVRNRTAEGCFWQQEFPNHLDQEEIKTHSCWLPNDKTMKVCASCRHTNMFCYDGDDIHNPEINNDLYCELSDFHNKTPINRRELFKEYRCTKEFGVGFYHRNHEFDTCDCWEPRSR